jgi:putative methionine-R-sulfoxide reductase with GAF domain
MSHESGTPTHFVSKEAMYDYLTDQFNTALFAKPKFSASANLVTGLSNAAALLFYSLNALADPAAPLQELPVNWVGFYLLQTPDVMTLGPFQGKVACTEIRVGKGVCGTAVASGLSQVVPDVHLFPGHIACDSGSNSELVVLIRTATGSIVGVLDIDSTHLNFFDDEDRRRMEQLAARLGSLYSFPFARPCATESTAAFSSAVLPKDVVVSSVLLAPFRICTTKHPVIASSVKRIELEARLDVLALPEILFPHNELAIVNEQTGCRLLFSAAGAIARSRLDSRERHPVAGDALKGVTAAQSWSQAPYAVFDPKVDWAWRNDYDGEWSDADGQTISADHFLITTPGDGINWQLLRDTTQPLLMFDHIELFEDDLHDGGLSALSVKVRVMPGALFVLLRHFVRVDGRGAASREVRIFRELSSDYTYLEVSNKVLSPEALQSEAVQALLHHDQPEDQLTSHMATVSVTTRRIKF